MNHRRNILPLGCVLLAALATSALQAQTPDPATVEFRSEKLGESVYALFGAGGNLAVLTGAEGTLLVDDELEVMTAKLRAALERRPEASGTQKRLQGWIFGSVRPNISALLPLLATLLAT